ncbi:uncharacterized protein LTR77_008988 [Saxophila tyrrhenica]|uniref:Zn(2)-C6 fungal-type domain-containing protein n=1 Tax=Saxophila tyrrhenica TaxID=1690608 RepID=A0AAV9NZU1_9PEZI|nr:hypothetical protein LTR77_008988 [Saxophila tyrrhenica]
MSTDHTRLADSLLHTLQPPESPKPPTDSNTAAVSSKPAEPPATSQAAGLEPRQAQARMRSSIACIRCRRSKVKCVNSGVGTPCRSCENSGRECLYPSPVTTGTRRRDSLSGGPSGLGEGERRVRPKKSNHTFVASSGTGLNESLRPALDALDSRLLTPQVWQELFDIFQIHYSADLPFVHPPTFLKPLRQANMQPSPTIATPNDIHSGPRPPVSPEFLLSFLALTARFHPKLVSHHSPPTSARPSNPLIAAEYYAAAASEKLSNNWTESTLQDIDRIQALLMLGLHEWGMCRGAKAWLTIGSAIRQAQAMGLQYEMDLDDEPLSRSMALHSEAERLGVKTRSNSISEDSSTNERDAFIQQEVRRRTFWSCYIMDRYLSSGKYRPQMLQAKELRIQLPASERSFLFAEKVRTLMLGEEEHKVAGRAEVQSHRQASLGMTGTPDRKGQMHDSGEPEERLQVGADEGLVSRYVKILEIYGKVVKWSCAGGRRTEQHPPWDPRCEFYQLNKQCLDFKNSLPRDNMLSPSNTQAHISMKSSTPYTLIHCVYLLCQIALHREYVPFLPIRCEKPEGPLDPPLFPSNKYEVPARFWEESARECFKSARELMDLVRACQEWSVLVETPIVGFAIYTVAFVGVYCINFPQMDPGGFMCTPKEQRQDGSKAGASKGFEAARKALEMLGQLRTKLHMADGWFSTINRMHKYLRRMKSDYKKNAAANESITSGSDSPTSTRHLSIREGGIGGGLDEFKLLERVLKEFGSLEDQDSPMADVSHGNGSRPLDAVYDDSGSGTTVKSEEQDRGPPPSSEPQRSGSGLWSAINAAPSTANTSHQQSSTPTTNGQFRAYDSYQQSHQQTHAPPAPQPNYAHQINNFRPAYSHDSTAGAPPSLTSPGSHTATTPSNASPPFDRQHQQYTGWAPHNAPYAMQHSQAPPGYPPGLAQHPQQQHLPPGLPNLTAYPTPGQTHTPQSMQPPAPPMQEAHQPWNQMEKEAWLNNLDTRLGGDDLAAFVDGGDVAEWASMHRGYGGGWLSAVWGDNGAGGGMR